MAMASSRTLQFIACLPAEHKLPRAQHAGDVRVRASPTRPRRSSRLHIIPFAYTRQDCGASLPNSVPIENVKTESGAAASAEWKALLECAAPHADSTRLRELLHAVSWPALFTLAEEHGVIALLAGALRRFDDQVAPRDIAQKIREYHRAQVLSAMKMTAELFRLVDLFRAARLETVLVKGPTLAMRAYGDTGSRIFGDLDFVVRQRDILRATELMIAAGYDFDVSPDDIRSAKIPGQYSFVRNGAPLLVELHTERTMRYFPRGLPVEKFFAARQCELLDGHEIPVLSVEHELVLVCIHGAKHLWERLTLVADVAALAARQTTLNWQESFAAAEDAGAGRMLRTGLILAEDLLRAPLPQDIQSRIRADAAASRLAREIAVWLPSAGDSLPGLLQRALFRMRMRGAGASGLGYLLKLTFSPTQEDWHSADGQDSTASWSTLRRPFRLAKKYRRPENER
jgi:Uncharacterised nucleotidyltransferase